MSKIYKRKLFAVYGVFLILATCLALFLVYYSFKWNLWDRLSYQTSIRQLNEVRTEKVVLLNDLVHSYNQKLDSLEGQGFNDERVETISESIQFLDRIIDSLLEINSINNQIRNTSNSAQNSDQDEEFENDRILLETYINEKERLTHDLTVSSLAKSVIENSICFNGIDLRGNIQKVKDSINNCLAELELIEIPDRLEVPFTVEYINRFTSYWSTYVEMLDATQVGSYAEAERLGDILQSDSKVVTKLYEEMGFELSQLVNNSNQ